MRKSVLSNALLCCFLQTMLIPASDKPSTFTPQQIKTLSLDKYDKVSEVQQAELAMTAMQEYPEATISFLEQRHARLQALAKARASKQKAKRRIIKEEDDEDDDAYYAQDTQHQDKRCNTKVQRTAGSAGSADDGGMAAAAQESSSSSSAYSDSSSSDSSDSDTSDNSSSSSSSEAEENPMAANARTLNCIERGCTYSTQNEYLLTKHTGYAHNQNHHFICNTCSFRHPSQQKLDTHITYKHSPQETYCNLCNKDFGRPYRLKQHMQQDHRDQRNGSFACNTCNATFFDACKLQEHELSHKPKIACEKCGEILATSSMRTHMQTHQENKPVYPCSFPGCTHISTTSGNIKKHIRAQHDKIRFPCPVCNKSFVDKGCVSRHIKDKHPGTTPYQCDVNNCNQSFMNESERNKHRLQVHDKTKKS